MTRREARTEREPRFANDIGEKIFFYYGEGDDNDPNSMSSFLFFFPSHLSHVCTTAVKYQVLLFPVTPLS